MASPSSPAPPTADPDDNARGSGIQVIARAMAVLRALQHHPEGLSLGELAKLLALPRSTVQRIVEALDQENLVIAASTSRGVRLGPALIALAAATRFEVAEIARPTLVELSRTTGETVDLSLCDGEKLVFVDQVISEQHRLRAESAVGIAFPLHCTANGKAMLAAMSDDALARLKPKLRLVRHTPNSITTWPALMRELQAARLSGISTDIEENSLGICAVSMALTLPTGELAAISIPVPTPRFAQQRTRLEDDLRRVCGRLQSKLTGGR